MIGINKGALKPVNPNLKLELKFNYNTYTDLAATVAANTNDYVRAWRSTVGGHLFTQSTDAARPQKYTDGLYFDGGDWLTGGDSADFNIGVGAVPFTVQTTFIMSTFNQFVLFSRGGTVDDWNSTTGNQYWFYFYHPSNSMYWRWWNGSSMAQLVVYVGFAINTLYNVEVSFDGTTTRLWVNGTFFSSATGAYAKPSGATGFKVGVSPLNTYNFNGKVDSLKIYNGVALHSSNANY